MPVIKLVNLCPEDLADAMVFSFDAWLWDSLDDSLTPLQDTMASDLQESLHYERDRPDVSNG